MSRICGMRTKSLNILVVDDETAVTASLIVVLRKPDCEVDAVHDGSEALAKLTESPDRYHILITDHYMQTVGGLELVEKLRKRSFLGKIIVLSGYLSLELQDAYRKLGVDRIIKKPFDLQEIRQAIAELRAQYMREGFD